METKLTKTTDIKITEKSKTLFIKLADDAGNWAGCPLLTLTSAERGNLIQLKRAGLLTTMESDGAMFAEFTKTGYQLACELSEDYRGDFGNDPDRAQLRLKDDEVMPEGYNPPVADEDWQERQAQIQSREPLLAHEIEEIESQRKLQLTPAQSEIREVFMAGSVVRFIGLESQGTDDDIVTGIEYLNDGRVRVDLRSGAVGLRCAVRELACANEGGAGRPHAMYCPASTDKSKECNCWIGREQDWKNSAASPAPKGTVFEDKARTIRSSKEPRTSSNIVEFQATGTGRPSWKTHGEGCWWLFFSAHTEAKWVSFTAGEKAEKGASKEVLVTLEEEDARRLYETLGRIFG